MKIYKIIAVLDLIYSVILVSGLYYVLRLWHSAISISGESLVPGEINMLIGLGGWIGIVGILGVISSLGLLCSKKWGFYLSYVFIFGLWALSLMGVTSIEGNWLALLISLIFLVVLILEQRKLFRSTIQ